jgi:hypothetical protein
MPQAVYVGQISPWCAKPTEQDREGARPLNIVEPARASRLSPRSGGTNPGKLQDLVVIRVHQAFAVLDPDSFWFQRQNVAGKFNGLFGLPVMG